jgi:predicted GNAT family acetyltransferase
MEGERHPMSLEVTDNRQLNRFELPIDGQTAFLAYVRTADAIRLVHTEVPPAFRGRGVGERLVSGALTLARAEGLRVVPECSFVRAYVRKHPEAIA